MNELSSVALSRKQMAWRAAQDIEDGFYVNLGIGMPTLCSGYVPDGRHVTYQSENGILGVGPSPAVDQEDFDLINASKAPVTLLPGASFVVQADSFAMIRGGHIDLAILGAFQIAPNGDLANWSTGDDGVPAVGGAMDLVAGAKAVRCLTTHVTKSGAPKLVASCAYPLTGLGVVSRIYTDLAVVDVSDGKFILRELVEGLSTDEISAMTDAPLLIAPDLKPLIAPAL
ncbi:MAG: 3-oxoacid CoA-transferase subunit B [Pseudomonadota bacterium]